MKRKMWAVLVLAAVVPATAPGRGDGGRARGDEQATLRFPDFRKPFFGIDEALGERRMLTILWDPQRPDHPAPAREEVEALLFGAKDSVSDYFRENSAGRFRLVNAGVLGWYDADRPADHYWGAPDEGDEDGDGWVSGHTEKWAEAVRKADAVFDFQAHDADRDGVLAPAELCIHIVIPQNNPFGTNRPPAGRQHPEWEPLVVDGVRIPVIAESYIGRPPHLGLVAHELAHLLLNTPDEYFTFHCPYAAGPFSLMDAHGHHPHLDPFLKLRLGWLEADLVTEPGWRTLADVAVQHRALVLCDPRRSGSEYFIVENRRPGASYDRGLPDAGLAIWHIIDDPEALGSLPPPPGVSQEQWRTIPAGDWGRRAIRLLRPFHGPPLDPRRTLWKGADAETAEVALAWADGTPSGFVLRALPPAGPEMRFYVQGPSGGAREPDGERQETDDAGGRQPEAAGPAGGGQGAHASGTAMGRPFPASPSPDPESRFSEENAMNGDQVVYTYTLSHDGTPESYDESLAVACLQGIINRGAPRVYVLSPRNDRPRYWLDVMSQEGRWLHGREVRPLADLDALRALAGDELRGAVIWDPEVPASLNVATTIAGVEDAVALSPEYAERYRERWGLRVLRDLRGRFTGEETGSAKNDAYRWALREYLARGACSAHLLCLYEDSFSTRASGNIGYVLTRDWAVKHRAFVFDLSPWGDEVPGDDPGQRLGLDLETYHLILAETLRQSAGEQMTELAGFFAFAKYSNVRGHVSAHDPVPTEWETVWLISPYNCYQNTVASDCFNQSFHSHARRRPLRQRRPTAAAPLQDKTYLCILMADYDSTTPLYQFMPRHWDDPERGRIPLLWGINPNLLETYPDLIAYLYETASENDLFGSDASAAGYMNPNRIAPEHLPLFIEHNRRFFREADMTLAPMVLDWDQPSPAVKDAFRQFAPDGFATIVMDLHGTGGRLPEPHVWKGMPVTELINNACNFAGVEQTADIMYRAIRERSPDGRGFFLFRIVWTSPGPIIATLERLQTQHPDLDLEILDAQTFFELLERRLGG